MKQQDWINGLTNKTQYFKETISALQKKDDVTLNKRLTPESWSVLECIEHLNRYGDFYLPALRNQISLSTAPSNSVFKSSWLGSYFAKSMEPKEKLNKMKTFRDKNPIHSQLDSRVIEKCLAQQEEMLELLKLSENKSLHAIRIPTTLSKWIRMNAGDTFHFIIQHNLRHLKQIENILN
ncbi:MAG: DinB family protein [Fluviicola sp.]|jgi:hypothetical protein